MTKLEIEAIRALPEEYVVDGVDCAVVGLSSIEDVIVCIHAGLPPMMFRLGRWSEITLISKEDMPAYPGELKEVKPLSLVK